MNKIPPFNKSEKESKDFLNTLYDRLINNNPVTIKVDNYNEHYLNDFST